jgi:hypothetical protein
MTTEQEAQTVEAPLSAEQILEIGNALQKRIVKHDGVVMNIIARQESDVISNPDIPYRDKKQVVADFNKGPQVFNYFYGEGVVWRAFIGHIAPEFWSTLKKAYEERTSGVTEGGDYEKVVSLYQDFSKEFLKKVEHADPEAFEQLVELLSDPHTDNSAQIEAILSRFADLPTEN